MSVMPFPIDPLADDVIERLHAQARHEKPALAWMYATQLPSLLLGRGLRFDPASRDRFDDKVIPVGPDCGAMLYLLARASRATRIVEFGTSFGLSTIYLASAVRDNGGGLVIGSELVPAKVAAARAHLEEAGLTEFVDIREGDARETLAQLDEPIDLFLVDGFPDLALEILDLVEPHLRPGALVVMDDVSLFRADLAPLVARLSDPSGGYACLQVPVDDGILVAVRRGVA